MSRSMTPPSTLSKEDIRTLADVRREIWTNAIYGMGVGSSSGVLMHSMVSAGSKRQLWKLGAIATSRNTLLASFILGGTLGSFLMAVTTGKNEVHNLHPIYGRGARTATKQQESFPPPTTSDPKQLQYRESLLRAKQRETDLRTLERRRSLARPVTLYIPESDGHFVDELSVERVQRERNRLFRRATLAKQMEEGHGGLSDSHGGRWVKD